MLRGSDVARRRPGADRRGAAGISKAQREPSAGQEFVSLSITGTGRVIQRRRAGTATAHHRGSRASRSAGPRPAFRCTARISSIKADTSGFLNYAVNYTSDGQVDLFAESALSVRGALLYNTVSATQSATRGLTSVTIDQRQQMRRWTFGDSLGFTGPLGGDAWIAGVTVAKEFAINPYFVRHPTLSLSTPISVPSVMEVQVNGQVVSREQVAPGRLEVRNLPMTLGRNDAQVIIRDAFGVERELSSTYYLTTTALAKGVQDYQYSVGFRREASARRVGITGRRSRSPVIVSGITDNVTAGGRVELQPGQLFSAGPSLNLRLPVGEVEAAASVSRTRGEWGSASLVGFSFTGRPVSAGGSVRLASRQLRDADAEPAGRGPGHRSERLRERDLSAGLSASRCSTRWRDCTRGSLGRERACCRRSMSRATSSSRQACSRVRDERGRGREVYAGITILLGRSHGVGRARARYPRQSDVGRRAALAAGRRRLRLPDARRERRERQRDRRRPLPGPVRALRAPAGDAERPVEHDGQRQRIDRRNRRRPLRIQTRAGQLRAREDSRRRRRPRICQSPGSRQDWAQRRLAGARSSRVLREHSGRGGRRTFRSSTPVPDVGQTLALPYRGGAVALFGVQKVQRVVGTIMIARGPEDRVPSYGEITVTAKGREFISPVGSSGRFYFEDLPAARTPPLFETATAENARSR